MPLKSWQDAEKRLADPKPLSSEEICDLFEHMNQIGETAMRRLVLQDLRALQDFEQSSRKLTKWLIGLTGVLVILTIVIAFYTVVLARSAESHQRFTHIGTTALGNYMTYVMFDSKTAQACWAGPPGPYPIESPDGKQRKETNGANIPFCKDLK
jgi:hypothetical protein